MLDFGCVSLRLRQRVCVRLAPHTVSSLLAIVLIGGPIVAIALVPTAESQADKSPSSSVLGEGKGLDHVVVAVRDLEQARHDYESLGFKFRPGGHFPGGVHNAIIRFDDGAYLELIAEQPVEPAKGSSGQESGMGIAAFAKKHEGAMMLGLNVSSATDTSKFLKVHNFDVDDLEPGSSMKEGETKPPPPQWYAFGTVDKPAHNKLTFRVPIFFIQYLDVKHGKNDRDRGLANHANSAAGIRAVWFAVHDLQAQMDTLQSGGFAATPANGNTGVEIFSVPRKAVSAGKGSILLLASSDDHSAVARYLSDHDDGIFAVSIEVADLARAQQSAETAEHKKPKIYRGTFGRSFLLSPDQTHGVWLEVFQPY